MSSPGTRKLAAPSFEGSVVALIVWTSISSLWLCSMGEDMGIVLTRGCRSSMSACSPCLQSLVSLAYQSGKDWIYRKSRALSSPSVPVSCLSHGDSEAKGSASRALVSLRAPCCPLSPSTISRVSVQVQLTALHETLTSYTRNSILGLCSLQCQLQLTCIDVDPSISLQGL